MTKLYDALKKIREARDNNRLVVFVGAGISKNSHIPGWGELIAEIAKEIGYTHCKSCKQARNCKNDGECPFRDEYDQTEFLKVPGYLFHKDKDRYETLLKEKIKTEAEPNPIDDLIMDLLPHHIITTNFDDLLERSKNVNTRLYSVIKADKDFEPKANDRYIIKMHGDIDDIDSIVLKEEDFNTYEQSHPIVSTFIRALFLDHTFLFLGYSLNDNDLKLIKNWCDFHRQRCGSSHQLKHYLLTDVSSAFEKEYLEKQGIYTIDTDIVQCDHINIPKEITASIGKKVYCFLNSIVDTTCYIRAIGFEQRLQQAKEAFKSYKWIAKKDLDTFGLLPEGYSLSGDTLRVDVIEKYNDLVNFLQNDKEIQTFLAKAGIVQIECNDRVFEIPSIKTDKYYDLYLNNKYVALFESLEHSKDLTIQLYYMVFLQRWDKRNDCIEKKALTEKADSVELLMEKIRIWLSKITPLRSANDLKKQAVLVADTLPNGLKDVTGFLRQLLLSKPLDYQDLEADLEKHEKRYSYSLKDSFITGTPFFELQRIKKSVYEYYYFFKKNLIPIDHFTETKKLFSYYTRAILCTYSPLGSDENELFGIATARERYSIDDIDLDIIVKYSKPNELINWIRNYHITTLEFNENNSFSLKYKNLCFSCCKGSLFGDVVFDQLQNMTYLAAFSNSQIQDMAIESLANVFFNAERFDYDIADKLIKALILLAQRTDLSKHSRIVNRLLRYFGTNEDVYSILSDARCASDFRYLLLVLKKEKTKYTAYKIADWIASEGVDRKKINKVYVLRNVIPRWSFKRFLTSNVRDISCHGLLEFLYDKQIDFSNDVQDRFISAIEELSQKEQSAIKQYPDPLKQTIDDCVMIHLLGYDFDLGKLSKYCNKSKYLQFVLFPDSFDYSQVDFDDYMWQNLFSSKKHRKILLAHKEEIFNDTLRIKLKLGKTSDVEKKYIYGFLMEKDEIVST